MSVMTRSGDYGETSLLEGSITKKSDIRLELIGSLDELNSFIGLSKTKIQENEVIDILTSIQKRLSIFMAHISDLKNNIYTCEHNQLVDIENLILDYEKRYICKKGFITYGKNEKASYLDVARAITRRCERELIRLKEAYNVDSTWCKYLNRLSDLLFVLARYIEFYECIEEILDEVMIEKCIKKDGYTDMNLEMAKNISNHIERKAKQIALPVVIAIANNWGHIIMLHSMDDALPGSVDIALNKAYTSSVLRMDTKVLGNEVKNNDTLFGIENTNQGKIVVFGGGVVLTQNNKVIGSIGVSGGSEEQDIFLAEYGRNFFKEVL